MQTFHHCLNSCIQAHPDVHDTLNVDFSTEGQINQSAMEQEDYSILNEPQLLHKSPYVGQRTNTIPLMVIFLFLCSCRGKR